MKENYPEFLIDIGDKITDHLVEKGLREEHAIECSWAVTEHIRLEWGGQIYYECKMAKESEKDKPLEGQESLFETQSEQRADLPRRFLELRQVAAIALDSLCPPEIVEMAAEAVAVLIKQDLSGSKVYFPNGRAYELALRDEEIFRCFSRERLPDICKKFKISEQRVYQVISKELSRRQGNLKLNSD